MIYLPMQSIHGIYPTKRIRSPMFPLRRRQPERGLSLLEAMIAGAILAFVSVTTISGMIYSSRASRLNTNSIAAKNIAQGFFERMAIDRFNNVGPNAYPNIAYNDPNPVYLDESMGIRCRVDFAFKGFGLAESGSATSLRDDDANWETDEWAGDTVYLVDGYGAGQFALIRSNTSNQLNFDSSILFPPDSTTKYMVNNGKTVEITTTWQYMGKTYTSTIESLVINSRNEPLGF